MKQNNSTLVPGPFDVERLKGRAEVLRTDRLLVVMMTRQELEQYLADVDAFARSFGLSAVPSEPDEDTRNAFNWLIEESLKCDAESVIWVSLWAFVDSRSGKLVGNACFKGAPIDGEAEIGYGIEADSRRRGYMTEALRAFVAWGRERRDLRGIVAETIKDNVASQKALERAGFQKSDRKTSEEDAFFWRVDCSK